MEASITFSVDLSWTAATDNIGVSSYDIFVNGNVESATSETSISLNNHIVPGVPLLRFCMVVFVDTSPVISNREIVFPPL